MMQSSETILNDSVAIESIADKVEVIEAQQSVLTAMDQEEERKGKGEDERKGEESMIEEKKKNFKRYNQWRQERTNKIHEVSVLHQNIIKKLDLNIKASDEINSFINGFFKEELGVIKSHVSLLKKNRATQQKKQVKQSKKSSFYESLDQFLMKMNQHLDTDITQQLDYINFITNGLMVKLTQERKDYKVAVAMAQKKIVSKSAEIQKQEKLVSKMNVKLTGNFIQMVKVQQSKVDFYVEEKSLIMEQNRFDVLMGEMGVIVNEYFAQLESLEKQRVELYRQVYSDYLAKQRVTFGDTLYLKQLSSIMMSLDVQKELTTVREVLSPEVKERLAKPVDCTPFDQSDLVLVQLQVERDVATFATEFKKVLLTFTVDFHLLMTETENDGLKHTHQFKSNSLQMTHKKNEIYVLQGNTKGFFGGDSLTRVTLRISDQIAAQKLQKHIAEHGKQ